MNWIKNVEGILKNGKWVKNSLGMGRVQFAKLVEIDEELMIFILSESYDGPIFTRVENLFVSNNELIVFYDGEYTENIEITDYDEYESFFSDEEWEAMFRETGGEGLLELNIVSKKELFFAELNENINDYVESGYDEEATDALCERFNI